MCRTTLSHCIDCKGEYWEINDEACFMRFDMVMPMHCYNMTLDNMVELREAMECALCKGQKETQTLRFTKPIGLRQRRVRECSRDRECASQRKCCFD